MGAGNFYSVWSWMRGITVSGIGYGGGPHGFRVISKVRSHAGWVTKDHKLKLLERAIVKVKNTISA